MAPEIFESNEYGYGVDIWSLGVLLYAMLNGTVPFKAETMDELHERIKKGKFSYRVNVSQDAKSLLEACINTDPDQ